MNIVIVGIGNVGIELVEQLSNEGHNLVVVDNDAALVENTVNQFDIKGVLGNGASYEVLQEADVKSCDLLVACTHYDEMNILTCLVAKKLGAKDTIARVRNPEYYSLFIGNELGINMMVNPEHEVAMEIARLLRFPSAIKIEPFAEGKIELVELKVPEDSVLAEVQLRDVQQKLKLSVLVCAVIRDGQVYIPSGDFTIKAGDKIYVSASVKSINQLFRELGLLKGSKRVMIIGGSRTAYYLATALRKSNISVKIIEKDPDKCDKLDELLDKCEIICGDGTDQELLIDEGILNMDAVVTLFGIDEQNIIVSMFASSKGIKKVITKVEKHSYYAMLSGSGVDSIVSTRASTSDQIVRYARSKENAHGSTVCRLYSIVDDKAEALEFNVTTAFKGASTPIKDLKLVPNMLIAGIIRSEAFVTPGGGDTIEPGDRVIIVTTNEQLGDLNDILE